MLIYQYKNFNCRRSVALPIALQYSRSHLLVAAEFRDVLNKLTEWKVRVHIFTLIHYCWLFALRSRRAFRLRICYNDPRIVYLPWAKSVTGIYSGKVRQLNKKLELV